ncbi:MAG TPA: ABC transporter ATP-binding protein [Acidimicrobiales bacterium]|nr:ABC transporter ATP-binding protein [Acidimicrobiales bacterium]
MALGIVKDQDVVSVDHITQSFRNGVTALQDVSLRVKGGEFLSLVGPSGCGKSTLLRLVAGLGRPTGGRLGVGVAQDQLAFVFQDATLLPWRSVLHNVALPLELRRQARPVRERAARDAIELVGLSRYEKALPRQLSGGMRMRVSIARALVAHPLLLLMDEPFGALDEITRQTLQSELLRIWAEENCTVMFVTHNVSEAVYLSTRIAVMTPSPGRIADLVDVSLPYPRTAKLRTSAEFTEVVEQVSSSLFRYMTGSNLSGNGAAAGNGTGTPQR